MNPLPNTLGEFPPGKLASQMTTEALNNFKFAGGSKSAYLAEPAAVGSRANMADIEFVKENKPKMAGMSKFFNVCDDADVQSFRSSCQHGFNKLIVQGGENYYLLPEAVYDEATKMEASLDTENGKKQSKETRMEKISKFYTKALSSMSQQILGMLVPGQVEMISRQQEDEEKVSTSMSSIGETLETILAKFEFYATEHKKMNTTLKESVNAQKDLVAKVDLYRQENEKLRQELALKEFNRQNRPDSDQAGYIGMRDPKHAHNLENGFPFDRNFPGQHELAKQLKKMKKTKRKVVNLVNLLVYQTKTCAAPVFMESPKTMDWVLTWLQVWVLEVTSKEVTTKMVGSPKIVRVSNYQKVGEETKLEATLVKRRKQKEEQMGK